jgi:hypothetical protein
MKSEKVNGNDDMYSPLTDKTEPMHAEIGWRGSIISAKGLYICICAMSSILRSKLQLIPSP